MLTLNDGRSELWQWDTGRKLTVDADCSQVHFSNKVFGRSIDVDVVDGVAEIPDFLLQTDKDLTAWAFVGTAENGYTKISKVFKVNKRNKPADYVFTPTDQTTLGDILERIEDLEKRPSGDVSEEDIQNAVSDYLDKNPISVEEKDPTVPAWAKQPNKPKYTAAEVGALPADTPIPEGVTDEQIQNAVDAYFTENPPEGGGIPIPTTASVGQTIVVKAVDETGKPIEWEVADFPSGGDKAGWELLADVSTTEEVSSFEITQCDDGSTIASKKYNAIVVEAALIGASTVTNYSPMYYNINGMAAGSGYGESPQALKGGEKRQLNCLCIHAGRPFYIARNHNGATSTASPQADSAEHITAFKIWGGAMAIGTNIKIYGVRL